MGKGLIWDIALFLVMAGIVSAGVCLYMRAMAKMPSFVRQKREDADNSA